MNIKCDIIRHQDYPLPFHTQPQPRSSQGHPHLNHLPVTATVLTTSPPQERNSHNQSLTRESYLHHQGWLQGQHSSLHQSDGIPPSTRQLIFSEQQQASTSMQLHIANQVCNEHCDIIRHQDYKFYPSIHSHNLSVLRVIHTLTTCLSQPLYSQHHHHRREVHTIY